MNRQSAGRGLVQCKYSKLTECIAPRMNSNVNYGLVIIMCQCRFISCNKRISLVVGVDNGGGWACDGAEECGTSLYPPLGCAVNLKLL